MVNRVRRQESPEEQFVTNAAHELQSPLTAIVSAVEVLQAGAKDTPERDIFLDHIEQAAARLVRLTRSLLVLSRVQTRLEAPRTELVELEPFLSDVAARVRTQGDVDLAVSCPADAAVVTNRELVDHALLNVLTNATNYTTNGRIELSARLDGEQPRSASRTPARGSPSPSRRGSSSASTAERPGPTTVPGSVWRSPGLDRGRGGYRRAGIGVGRRDDCPFPVSAGCEPGDGVSRVLIVEDEPAVRDALDYSLRGEGFDVDAAPDGEAGLRAAQAGDYDVVILDLMLPKMSGTEVCRRLRSESAVPIIMLTAKGAELDRVLGLEIGADDYVTKPFSMAELIGRIRAILRRRQLDRSGATSMPVGDPSSTRSGTRSGSEASRSGSRRRSSSCCSCSPRIRAGFQQAPDHAAPLGLDLRRRPACVRHPHLQPPAEDRGRSGQSGSSSDRGVGYKLTAVDSRHL